MTDQNQKPENQPAFPDEELKKLKQQKDWAYSERNKLVALVSTKFPASLERHPEEDKDWEDDWRWIVFIQLPTGQVSWHIHDSELPLFGHLQREEGVFWDGHTNDEKWNRVREFIKNDHAPTVTISLNEYRMQKRRLWDFFAAHALNGLLSNSAYDLATCETEKAEEAGSLADAMLAERAKRGIK